ncbi:hypothetical protein Ahy_A04g019861 [Arachis hypogaea]|uniref:Ribosomal protein S11 n=1 Tax=Arachis hypogaea TaxID=3818 RepID=A0A445DGR9_ARAHY|nr:hypothetical protein Ahy_A04g019861 [Arachis hypogaea]
MRQNQNKPPLQEINEFQSNFVLYCYRCTGSGNFVVPFAAQTAAGNVIRTVANQGMQRAEVMIKGPGLGRDAALRAIRRSGILLNFIRDVTPMPHNGCRSPKQRCV